MASSPWRLRAWLTELWRWLSQRVEAGQALEVIGLWAAFGAALAAISSSRRDSEEQVRAMRDQLQTMSGQLNEMHAEQRPWVSFDLKNSSLASGLIFFDGNDPTITIRYHIHNTGKLPARYVEIKSNGSASGNISEQKAFIENLKHWRPAISMTLFPNGELDFTTNADFSKQDVAKLISANRMAVPTITACITYFFMEEIIPHLTCTTFQLWAVNGLSFAGGSIDMNKLDIRRFPLGPDYAD
jgi:hypothetical protein